MPAPRLEGLESASHAIAVTRQETRYRVVLKDGGVPSDRDFRLRWQPVADGRRAVPALFVERSGERDLRAGHADAAGSPENGTTAQPAPARDHLRRSTGPGRWTGRRSTRPRRRCRFALDRLTPADTFNVIAFDDQTTSLFRAPGAGRPGDGGLRARLRRRHGGGRRHRDGAGAAARAERRTDPDRLRQVVFLTDGAVGNEEGPVPHGRARSRRCQAVHRRPGRAPNGWFMRKAAELGRGAYVAIDDLGVVEQEMRRLFARLEQPVLTGVEVAKADEPAAEIFPPVIPDLYAGEPVAFVARFTDPPTAPSCWTPTAAGVAAFDLADARNPAAGHRQAVGARQDRSPERQRAARRRSRPDQGGGRRAGAASTAWPRATPASSRSTTSRPGRRPPLATAEVPLNLPAGWSEEKVLAAGRMRAHAATSQPIAGPQTATPFLVHVATAACLCRPGAGGAGHCRTAGPRHEARDASARLPAVAGRGAGAGLAGWQALEAAAIPVKAVVAQFLLARAWATRRPGADRPRPWPWADTWPVGRLAVPRLEVDQIVLAGATGRTLAFGPARLDHGGGRSGAAGRPVRPPRHPFPVSGGPGAPGDRLTWREPGGRCAASGSRRRRSCTRTRWACRRTAGRHRCCW